MSGSEVEIYTTHAQLWSWKIMGKNPQTIQNNMKKTHRFFFFFFSKKTDQKPHRFFNLYWKQCIILNSAEYIKMYLFLPASCRKNLVAFRERSLHCAGINRDSFSMHGLNFQLICQELGEDRETRQVWGAALEAASGIPPSWRNSVFPHEAQARVENVFAIPWPM